MNDVKIIAEFCQNHNGDINVLKSMVSAAARAGATHGKIQMVYADNLVYRPQFETGLSSNSEILSIKRPYQEEYDRLKKLELTADDCKSFIRVCIDEGLVPCITCFAREQIPTLKELGFSVIKVASYDCASYQLLREIIEQFSDVIVSTGACFDEEIEYATEILRNVNFSLLHCVTVYPTPLESLHLARMNYLRGLCSFVGFSDHTLVERDGVKAAKAALALGANLVERHFTILPSDKTKDGPVSVNEKQLREISEFAALEVEERRIRIKEQWPTWEQSIGFEKRVLSHDELLNRAYYKGRFGSINRSSGDKQFMINNWEETPLG